MGFAVQDPRKTVPSKTTHPNHKVEPLWQHIEKVSREAITPGRFAAGDEMDEGFQGKHWAKQKIKYKAMVSVALACMRQPRQPR